MQADGIQARMDILLKRNIFTPAILVRPIGRPERNI
jgi:hypothetical protein